MSIRAQEASPLGLVGIKYSWQLLPARSVARVGLSGLGLRSKSAPCRHPAGLLESHSQLHRQNVLHFAAN